MNDHEIKCSRSTSVSELSRSPEGRDYLHLGLSIAFDQDGAQRTSIIAMN